jgi:hypothetical protein
MKYAALLTLLTCVSLVSFGQTPGVSSSSAISKCTLTRAQSPEIRGVRLGLTAEQLLALFPDDANRQRINEAIKQSKRADKYGFARFDLQSNTEVRDPRFAGLSYLAIDMLDERVTGFHIGYAGPEWNSVDQFVAKLSEAVRLPTALWEPPQGNQQSLKCDGFVVDAYVSRGTAQNSVRVQDTSVTQVVSDRRETAKEKERQAFKP